MIDLHSHILPEIDDGSSSVEMSLELLKELRNQGVSKVLLTPHFYAYASSVDDFKERKSAAIKKIQEALIANPLDIILYSGCEVLYFEELWRVDDLRDLCIKGTDYILVEMPFSQWSDSMVDSVGRIIGKGITPIIAHFERYLNYKGNLEKIYALVEMGAVLQMNCKYINDFMTRRKAIRFIKSGIVFAIGTDCHNMGDRAPNYGKALEILRKKLSERAFRQLCFKTKHILQNAEIISV